MTRFWILAGVLLLAALASTTAAAHEFRPAQITLHEFDAGEVDVVVFGGDPETVELRAPTECAVVEATRWRCPAGLGGVLTVHGLGPKTPTAVVRVVFADGRATTTVVDVSDPQLELRRSTTGSIDAVARYLELGASHLLHGVDHLAFILLLVFATARREWVRCVTAFTVGHSLTLAATVLGACQIPAAPVEAVIALSVVYMALAVIDRARGGVGASRAGATVCGLIGLLHGLGFSGALLDAGVSGADVWPALLGFNLGIEAAQLAFVLVLALAGAGLRRLSSRAATTRLAVIVGYIVGSLATALLLRRLLELGGTI